MGTPGAPGAAGCMVLLVFTHNTGGGAAQGALRLSPEPLSQDLGPRDREARRIWGLKGLL